MKAVGDYIIVKDEEIEQKNSLGLLVTQMTDNNIRYITGEVVSVGGEVKEITAGAHVYFDKVAGSGFRYEGERYKAIRERDVVITM
jgi:co-chaperonin GroES (HSP10)|tara:strand:+ start:2950 stop:3207 length:258 start_codon:yes stop_codon:yes gene_type:complete